VGCRTGSVGSSNIITVFDIWDIRTPDMPGAKSGCPMSLASKNKDWKEGINEGECKMHGGQL